MKAFRSLRKTALTLRTKAAAGRTTGGRQSRGGAKSLGGNTASSALGGHARKTQSHITKSPVSAPSHALTKDKSLGGLTKNKNDTVAWAGSQGAGSSTDRPTNATWECCTCGHWITAHSQIQLSKKKSGHLADNPGCLKGTLETETWTCPWCEMTVKAPDRNKLRKRRLNHLRYYHPDRDGSKSDTLIVHHPDVETSNF